jgi:hypothetical protein
LFAEDLEMMDYSEENYRIPKDPLLTEAGVTFDNSFFDNKNGLSSTHF